MWNVYLSELLTSKSHLKRDKGPQLDTAFCRGHKPKTACSYSEESKRTAGVSGPSAMCMTLWFPFESSSVIFLADFCCFSGANFKICSVHKWFDGLISAKTTEPEVFLEKFSTNRVTLQTTAPKQTHETSLWKATTDSLILWCCIALKSPFATLH